MGRSLVIALFALTLAAFAAAASARAAFGAGPLFSASGTQPVVLPSVFDGRVLVRAEINGQHLWFYLDTGSYTLVLSPLDARGAGIAVCPQTHYTLPVAVSIGAVRAPMAGFNLISAYGFEADGRRIAGLIGAPFFLANVVTIDYPRQRVLFYPRGTFAAPPAVKPIPMTLRHFLPVVDVWFGATRGRFYLDTGANLTEVSAGFARKLNLHDCSGTVATDAGGNVRKDALCRAPRITVAGTPIDGDRVAVADPARVDVDGLLGRDILSRFAVTLDYASALVYFAPATP